MDCRLLRIQRRRLGKFPRLRQILAWKKTCNSNKKKLPTPKQKLSSHSEAPNDQWNTGMSSFKCDAPRFCQEMTNTKRSACRVGAATSSGGRCDAAFS